MNIFVKGYIIYEMDHYNSIFYPFTLYARKI